MKEMLLETVLKPGCTDEVGDNLEPVHCNGVGTHLLDKQES